MAHVDAAEDLPDHHLILYADAAMRYEAPQCVAWAWMATDDERHELAHACGIVGCASWHTSNRAEFEAVIQALSWAAQHAHSWRVECRNDAANVIDLLHTETYEGRLQAFHQRGRALVQALDAAIVWVPRTDNRRADHLCRQTVKTWLARQGVGKHQAPTPPKERPTDDPWRELKALRDAIGRPRTEILRFLLDHAPWSEVPDIWLRTACTPRPCLDRAEGQP